MSTKRPSRFQTSTRSRGCAQLERHAPAYRQYLLDRGNAGGYVRNCEAAVAHLSVWMRQAAKRLACCRALKTDQPCALKIDQGKRPRDWSLGLG